MKKTLALILCLISFTTVSFGYSNSIIAKNDVEATYAKKYPVIALTNTKNYDLLVTYDFYISEGEDVSNQVVDEILVPANETVTLELNQLAFLGKTQGTRRVWFSWTENNIRKPQGTDIVTIPFESPAEPDKELGFNK